MLLWIFWFSSFAAHLYEILLDDTDKHLTLTDTAKQFSECLIYILPVKRALVSLHLMLTVNILILFSFRHSCGCIVLLMVVLNCISHVLWGAIGQRVRLTSWMSLETNEIELLFISLLSIWIFSFVKCLFQAFCLFFFHWIVRQFVICRSSIYILIWVPFLDICIAKVFSPIHWLTFSFT